MIDKVQDYSSLKKSTFDSLAQKTPAVSTIETPSTPSKGTPRHGNSLIQIQIPSSTSKTKIPLEQISEMGFKLPSADFDRSLQKSPKNASSPQ
jgi:hypothetical protein